MASQQEVSPPLPHEPEALQKITIAFEELTTGEIKKEKTSDGKKAKKVCFPGYSTPKKRPAKLKEQEKFTNALTYKLESYLKAQDNLKAAKTNGSNETDGLPNVAPGNNDSKDEVKIVGNPS